MSVNVPFSKLMYGSLDELDYLLDVSESLSERELRASLSNVIGKLQALEQRVAKLEDRQ